MHELEQKQIFDDWLHQHKGILFKIVRAYAFNAHDRDDLFQEIALQLWRSIPEFRGESKASTWIYRVALYAASAWTRREQRQPPTKPLDAVAQTLTMTAQPSDPRVDWLYEQIAQFEPIDRSLCTGNRFCDGGSLFSNRPLGDQEVLSAAKTVARIAAGNAGRRGVEEVRIRFGGLQIGLT